MKRKGKAREFWVVYDKGYDMLAPSVFGQCASFDTRRTAIQVAKELSEAYPKTKHVVMKVVQVLPQRRKK